MNDACHATGNQAALDLLQGQFHQAGHTLTGRCVNVEFADMAGAGKVGDCLSTGDTYRIRIARNMDISATLRVGLHELGHVKAQTINSDTSEASADFWRDTWLAKGERLALENFQTPDAGNILRALGEHLY